MATQKQRPIDYDPIYNEAPVDETDSDTLVAPLPPLANGKVYDRDLAFACRLAGWLGDLKEPKERTPVTYVTLLLALRAEGGGGYWASGFDIFEDKPELEVGPVFHRLRRLFSDVLGVDRINMESLRALTRTGNLAVGEPYYSDSAQGILDSATEYAASREAVSCDDLLAAFALDTPEQHARELERIVGRRGAFRKTALESISERRLSEPIWRELAESQEELDALDALLHEKLTYRQARLDVSESAQRVFDVARHMAPLEDSADPSDALTTTLLMMALLEVGRAAAVDDLQLVEAHAFRMAVEGAIGGNLRELEAELFGTEVRQLPGLLDRPIVRLNSLSPNTPAFLEAAATFDDGPPFLDVRGMVNAAIRVDEGLFRSRLGVGGSNDTGFEAQFQKILNGMQAGLTDGAGVVVASVNADDPFARPLSERSSIDDEAQSFAALAASTSLTPPLSIGVFGRWGAGKSFFMARMHGFVDLLARQGPAQPWFHDKIVQIRFNAWHYMETNLWASLVEHIFTELDRWLYEHKDKTKVSGEDLLGRLNTARTQQLLALEDVARKRRHAREAEAAETAASKSYDSAQETLTSKAPALLAKALWQTLREVLVNEKDRQKIAEAAAVLGYPDIKSRMDEYTELCRQLASDRGRVELRMSSLLPQLRRASALGVAFVVLVFLGVPLPFVRDIATEFPGFAWVTAINDAVLGAATGIGAVLALLARACMPIRAAFSTMATFQQQLADAEEKVKQEPPANVRALIREKEEALAELERAKRKADRATNEREKADAAIRDSTARARLTSFIHDKVRDAEYAKHLGIVSSIRKDFGQLAALMAEGREDLAARHAYEGALKDYKRDLQQLRSSDLFKELNKEEIAKLEAAEAEGWQWEKPFTRIILYVDDLDRCPPDKVVEVLQAIHLLLCFKLFVVVVAVDARWISRSLREQYPSLLDETVMLRDAVDGGHIPRERGTASSHDYLEKIFQLPYWVQPMNDRNSRDYAAKLISTGQEDAEAALDRVRGEREMLVTTLTDIQTEKSIGNHTSQKKEERSAPPEGTTNSKNVKPDENNETDVTMTRGEETTDTRPDTLSSLETAALLARGLDVPKAEDDLLQAFAPFVGRTPRRILRFVNSFRVIKTCLPEIGGSNSDGKNALLRIRALVCQLAIVTGAPELAHPIAECLKANRESKVNLEQVRRALGRNRVVVQNEGWPVVDAALGRLIKMNERDELSTNADLVQALADISEITTRYGFVTRRQEPEFEDEELAPASTQLL